MKAEWISRIIEVVKKLNITSYEIAKATSLSEVGVKNTIKRLVKNPNTSTLEIVSDYLNQKYLVDKNWLKTGEGAMHVENLSISQKEPNYNQEELKTKLKEVAWFVHYYGEELMGEEIFKTWVEREAYKIALDLIRNQK